MRRIKPIGFFTKNLSQPHGICTHVLECPSEQDMEGQFQRLKELGVDYIRTDIRSWEVIKDGKYVEDNYYVKVVECAQRYNIKVFLIFSGDVNGRLCYEDLGAYKYYVKSCLDQFAGVVKDWELVNEPDIFIKDLDPKRFYQAVCETYEYIQSLGHKDLRIVCPSLGHTTKEMYNHLLDAGGQFDVLNYHYYGKETHTIPNFQDVVRMAEERFLPKPIWVSECGMPTHGEEADRRVRELQQADLYPHNTIMFLGAGADKVIHYNLVSAEYDDHEREHHFGVLHRDLTPKPAFLSYKTMIQMLPDGSTRPVLYKKWRQMASTWQRPDGQFVCGLWCDRGHSRRCVTFLNGEVDKRDVGCGITYLSSQKKLYVKSVLSMFIITDDKKFNGWKYLLHRLKTLFK